MQIGRYIRRTARAAAFVAALGQALEAQDSRPEPQIGRLAEYLKFPRPLTGPERTGIADLARQLTSTTATESDRRQAATTLAFTLVRALGRDSATHSAAVGAIAARAGRGGHRLGPDFRYPSTPTGTLPEVVEIGTGPVSLILIPEFRKNWTIFEPFMKANAGRFRSYAFSLPGYGGTRPYPLPQAADYGARAWLDGVATAVERLIRTRRLTRPILVGALSAGTYVAVTVASRHPELVGGVVSLNGALFDASIGANPTPAERAAAVAQDPDVLLSVLLTREALTGDSAAVLARRPIAARNPVRFYTRDSVGLQKVYGMHLSFRPFLERYYFEWLTADLRGAVAQVRVPVLAIPSSADDGAPQRTSRSVHTQWAHLAALHPAAPIQIAPFEEVRGLTSYDAPAELGDAIAAFAAGRPVPRRMRSAFPGRESPRASVSQSAGPGTIRVTYGRLRGVVATAIPLDSLWNPGADEATTVELSHAMRVAGSVVPAGRYSLIVVPGATRWTFRFHRNADRWGAANDVPGLDAAAVGIEPEQGPRADWLTFEFDNPRPAAVDLVLRVDQLLFRLPIEAP